MITGGMTDQAPPNPPAPSQDSRPWAKATMWMVVVFLFVAGGLYVFKSIRDLPHDMISTTGTAVEKARNALMDVVAAFSQRTITTSFISYASSLHSSHYLQFATLRQTEVFTQTDAASTGFGYIPLPDVMVEARAPVEYTYYLDLNAKWELVLRDNVIYVLAPRIQFNKPAVDASEIQYEVRKGSVFRNSERARENLKQSITFLAQQRARENTSLVRDTGRKQTAEFVEKWLAKSFTNGTNYPVKVFFPGEAMPAEVSLADPLEPTTNQGLRKR